MNIHRKVLSLTCQGSKNYLKLNKTDNIMELVFEGTIKENKKTYTINECMSNHWKMKRPIMKKILWGIEIKKPTSYRVYKSKNMSFRTWVFGNLELNPRRHNIYKISK